MVNHVIYPTQRLSNHVANTRRWLLQLPRARLAETARGSCIMHYIYSTVPVRTRADS